MALCYDVRVSPYPVVAVAVERLRAAILSTAAVIYEVSGPLLEERVRLPGKYGGLTLRCGGEAEAAAAFWASWATHQCTLPGLAEEPGWRRANDPEEGYA